MRERRETDNLVGRKFGYLTVMKFSHLGKYGKYWECLCDCGNTHTIYTANLGRKGRPTASCGCYGQNVSRKYVINERFFEKIDTEEKAYWLGFIYADGNVTKNHRAFQIALQNRDEGHLEKMLKSFQSTHPIFKHRDISKGVMIKNKLFVKNLVDAGICPNKSYTIKPILLRRDLQRHFWRGVVDGDGTLSTRKHHQVISVAGNKFTCDGFGEFLRSNGVPTKAKTFTRPQSVSSFSVNGSGMTKLVSNLLYGNCTIFLDRKMEKAKTLGDF